MKQRIRTVKKVGNGTYYTNSMTLGESVIFIILKFTIFLPFYLMYLIIKYSIIGIKKLIEKSKKNDI